MFFLEAAQPTALFGVVQAHEDGTRLDRVTALRVDARDRARLRRDDVGASDVTHDRWSFRVLVNLGERSERERSEQRREDEPIRRTDPAGVNADHVALRAAADEAHD